MYATFYPNLVYSNIDYKTSNTNFDFGMDGFIKYDKYNYGLDSRIGYQVNQRLGLFINISQRIIKYDNFDRSRLEYVNPGFDTRNIDSPIFYQMHYYTGIYNIGLRYIW
jgi:hypothetical protein